MAEADDTRSRAREQWLLLLLAAVSLIVAYIFVSVSAAVRSGAARDFDIAVREWVLAHRPSMLIPVLHVITQLGAKELLVPLSAVIGWRVFRHNKGWIALLAYAVLAAAEFAGMVKRDLQLARPSGGIAADLGYGFPSGHAAGSAAIALVLSYVAIRTRFRPRVVVPVCVVIVALVGISRVYLDFHWASDVIGGWLVGAAFGTGCCALYEWVERRAAVTASRRVVDRTASR